MSFQPLLPLSGYAGWQFLTRTIDEQKEVHSNSAVQVRETTYFEERIGEITTAEELVSDHRLLSVALGAFGLQGDVDNKYFIQKVLEDGTIASDALSNRLADKTYYKLSAAFGFGDGLVHTADPGFAESIIQDYEEQQFETDVGEQNDEFRLALYTQRELSAIASGSLSDDGKWYSVMGSTPLRTVFETAFGLPSSFSSLDIDDQLETFREKAKQVLGVGELSEFSDSQNVDTLIQRYLLRAEISNLQVSTSSASVALTLLSQV